MRQVVPETNPAAFWRDLFSNWPEQRPRRGLIITAWQEHIPFDDYLVSEAVLFISRPQPDGLNARKVMLPFEQIVAVKFPDVFELDVFAPVGFQKQFERRQRGDGTDTGEEHRTDENAAVAEPVDVAEADGMDGDGAKVHLGASSAEGADALLDGLAHLERHVFGQSSAPDPDGAGTEELGDGASVVKQEAEERHESFGGLGAGGAVGQRTPDVD